MTCKLSELVEYVDGLLNAHSYLDGCHNGVQLEGKKTIKKIFSCESASLHACKAAAKANADILLVHHGLIWGGINRIDGFMKKRIETLIKKDCSLVAYHLPLDANEEWGNNSFAIKKLGAEIEKPFGKYKGNLIGFVGKYKKAISPNTLIKRCEKLFGQKAVVAKSNKKTIKRIGVVVGGGSSMLKDAINEGVDAFITGEASEQHYHEAKESNCHLIACGHNATEKFAIHILAKHLAKKYDLKHISVTEDNPF